MHTAYLLLGGNMGNVPASFEKALVLMKEAGIRIGAVGSLYMSEPWGEGVDGMFYNQAVQVSTGLDLSQLLHTLNTIESGLGRKHRPGVVESRPLDIDILFYDDSIVSEPGLQVPHPRLHLRNFALAALMDIAPDHIHPVFGKTVHQLLLESADTLSVKRLDAPGSHENSAI